MTLARIDTGPRAKNSKRADLTRRCPSHLKWLRGRPCCVGRRGGCEGRIEAAHVDRAGGKGVGLKVADWAAVPMCSGHHAEYHRGASSFEAAHSIDLVATAEAFARRSPYASLRLANAS